MAIRPDAPFGWPRSASETDCQNGVPCLDDGTTDLLTHPNTFRLAAIDLGDCTVTERIIVGGVDHDDVDRHVVEELARSGYLPNGIARTITARPARPPPSRQQ